MMAQRAEKSGRHRETLEFLGNAIHTMQDATSPAHTGIQEWPGLGWAGWRTPGNYVRAGGHVLHESSQAVNVGPGPELDRVTREAWDYFAGNLPLPREYFPPSACHP